MKILGKELKFNGFDIFHKGNLPTKTDVGLGSVDNTADSAKPISIAQQTALNLKADKTQVLTNVPANAKFTDTIYTHSSTHPMSMITGNLETDRLVEPSYVTGSITRTARPLFDVLRADRTAFLPPSQVIIERSIDGGLSWQDHSVTDNTKARLFTGQRPNIIIPLKDGVKNTDCMIRITVTGMRYNVPIETLETNKYNYWNSTYVQSTERYFSLSEGWTWVSANSDRIYCKVERATGGSSNNWTLDREAFMTGWSGGNYFSLSGSTFGGGTTQTANTWNWRFTFRTATSSNDFDNSKLATTYTTSAQTIHHIKLSGTSTWTTPNNLMYNDHLYSWDVNQNATFPTEVKATTFKKVDGTEVSYTDTITTINGKTGAITKADIVALGIPTSDTNTTYTAGTGLTLTGTVFTPTFGTTVDTVTQGNDARLSNARTPLAHSHTKSQITDFPALATVATSGSYADLSSKPTIPSDTNQLDKTDVYTKVEVNDLMSSAGQGDMIKAVYDTNNNGIVDNAEKVNGFTVGINVPANAKFTDTNTITTINGKTGVITKADVVALGIPAQDTVYSHPSSHPASIITESTTKRFVSDAEKTTWNNKANASDIPNKFVHVGTSQPTNNQMGWIDTSL